MLIFQTSPFLSDTWIAYWCDLMKFYRRNRNYFFLVLLFSAAAGASPVRVEDAGIGVRTQNTNQAPGAAADARTGTITDIVPAGSIVIDGVKFQFDKSISRVVSEKGRLPSMIGLSKGMRVRFVVTTTPSGAVIKELWVDKQ